MILVNYLYDQLVGSSSKFYLVDTFFEGLYINWQFGD